jgi:CelD/BcsL family acetyltransferase involved in cellulose biosynthesis
MKWQHRPASEFAALAPDWDALCGPLGAPPFLRAGFVGAALAAFGAGRERIVLAEDGAGPCAAAVLAPQGAGRWTTFQPSQLPLGAWLMRPGLAWAAVLDSLGTALPGVPLMLGVTQQDPALLPRPADAPRLETLDYIRTAWIDVAGSFDDYWNARGKNLRQNMRKQRRKLAEDGVEARLEVLTRPEDVAGAIADYGALESAGWKAGGGTAVHPDNAQGRFYRAMLEAHCAAGHGRIYRYRFGEKVVAVDLCIEGDGTLVILKTTYDESIKTLSPAFLMREDAFRQLFDEGRIRRIEFFGKLMEWHARWTDSARTLYHVNGFRWGWVRRLRARVARDRSPAGDERQSATYNPDDDARRPAQ